MAQLVQLKNRIRAVETIKKITHAMRLIAMSTNARLKHRQLMLIEYRTELSRLLAALLATYPVSESQHASHKDLIVVISSQKGLCGTFNSSLFKFTDKQLPQLPNADYITIGKKAHDYIHTRHLPIIRNLRSLSVSSLATVTHDLYKVVNELQGQYSSVRIISNLPVSFFLQQPTITQLLPVAEPTASDTPINFEDYIWPVAPEEIIKSLQAQYIESNIQTVLYQSLIAETAARFQSMDSANRNAIDLLDTMHRQYNKLRQAKITKELIELTAGFTQQQ